MITSQLIYPVDSFHNDGGWFNLDPDQVFRQMLSVVKLEISFVPYKQVVDSVQSLGLQNLENITFAEKPLGYDNLSQFAARLSLHFTRDLQLMLVELAVVQQQLPQILPGII